MGQAHQLARDVQRHRRDERHFGFRARPGFPTATLSTKGGIVQLHSTAKSAGSFLLLHGVVDLVMQQPCGGVALAQIALEGQCRYAGLAWLMRYMARNHIFRGNMVCSIRVPAVSEA